MSGNLISVLPCPTSALGLTRALGADAFFLNLPDFGYSKSSSEALRLWGRDAALAKLVRAIRLARPDVILTLPLESAVASIAPTGRNATPK